jgi:hypothetical protein
MTILTVGLHRFGDASIVVRPGRPEVASPITSRLRQSPTRNNRSSRAIDDAADYLQAGSLV